MTDRVRTAGWAAAAVLAPLTAALFAGTTAWAASHVPAPPTGASTGTASTGAAATAAAVPQQILDEDTARVAALEQLVATLRAQAVALVPGTAGAVAGPAQAAASAPSTPSMQVASRRPALVRSVARPPAVHAVTGAS